MAKTKFILHGGMMRWQTDANKLYYQETVKSIVNPKVLLVYFARQDDEISELIKRDKNSFVWANPGLIIEFTVATEKNFVEQVMVNDIIFLAGGETQKLINTVIRTEINLGVVLDGKTLSGSSAGAYLISEWYYTNSGKEIRQGLGLLPIAVWAHYRAEEGTEFYLPETKEQEIKEELIAKIGDGELVLLREQEMIVR